MYIPPVEGMTRELKRSLAVIDNEYVCTLVYRGIQVDIFIDDYGQCYYAKIDHEDIHLQWGLGSYNMSYEWEVKDVIDHILDKQN